MPGLLDFAKMVQQLQGGGLLGNVVPVGDVIDMRGKFKGINPLNTTEGARPYYGGGGAWKGPRTAEMRRAGMTEQQIKDYWISEIFKKLDRLPPK
jgi:hypothetical protein